MRPTHGHRARRSTSATRPPSCPDDGDFAEFAAEVAPLVDCDAEAAIPEPLRDYELPEPPADLAVRPYRHVAVVEATEPLPAPAPQTDSAARRLVAAQRARHRRGVGARRDRRVAAALHYVAPPRRAGARL